MLAYNLELFGGSVHSDLWFALAWGAFPVVTASFAQSARVEPEAIALAAACAAISAAQRVLSTPVRRLRRQVATVEGTITSRDGDVEPIDAGTLRPLERALRWMSLAMPLLALGMLLPRLPG